MRPHAGRQVVDAEEMVNKIRSRRAARQDPDFLIIARTGRTYQPWRGGSHRRARLYEQAGADIIFVESLESVEEMRMVNEAIAKPTIANMVETGRTPLLTAAQLQEIGYDMVVFPISTLFVAAKAVYDMLMDLRANGTTRNAWTK